MISKTFVAYAYINYILKNSEFRNTITWGLGGMAITKVKGDQA